MSMYMSRGYSFWQGLPPPQFIFKNLRFIGVALEPPTGSLGLGVELEKLLWTMRMKSTF